MMVLGTSPTSLSLGSFLGIWAASVLAFTRLNTKGLAVLTAAGCCGYLFIVSILIRLPAAAPEAILRYHNFDQHASLILITLILAAWTTWFFWRSRSVVTWELVCLSAFFIYLLSGTLLSFLFVAVVLVSLKFIIPWKSVDYEMWVMNVSLSLPVITGTMFIHFTNPIDGNVLASRSSVILRLIGIGILFSAIAFPLALIGFTTLLEELHYIF